MHTPCGFSSRTHYECSISILPIHYTCLAVQTTDLHRMGFISLRLDRTHKIESCDMSHTKSRRHMSSFRRRLHRSHPRVFHPTPETEKKGSIFLESRSRLRETVNKKTTRCVILTLGVKPVQLVIHVLKKLAEGWGQYSTRRKNPEEGIRFRNSNRRSRVCYFPGCRMLPHSIS